jgi:site-specific DNA-methyltransferase (adenine-specific)
MKVINGNNIDLLKQYPDNYFDAVVTDPPYGLGKEPIAEEVMKDWVEKGYHEISGSGFMGKEWDAFIPQPIFWKEVFRVLKHGGHVLAFYGTRTYDWGVMSMRFAGFEVRDCIQWLYGSGFPKSHNIGKSVDKLYGNEREIKDWGRSGKNSKAFNDYEYRINQEIYSTSGKYQITKGNSEWEGWGSALKPANEPIVLARKPLEKGLSIAENVLKWGTGGINIDGCRVGFKNEADYKESTQKNQHADFGTKPITNNTVYGDYSMVQPKNYQPEGRFPANLILTHHPECELKGLKKVKSVSDYKSKDGYDNKSIVFNGKLNSMKSDGYADENGEETIEHWECHEDCPIRIMDEQSGISKGVIRKPNGNAILNTEKGWNNNSMIDKTIRGHADSGGSSRFFYCAKASKSERNNGLNGFEEIRYAAGNQAKAELKRGNVDFNANEGKGKDERNNFNQVGSNKNFHPTVKPVKLMQYLVRMITPPNGIVLDPFCGSGTTGIACKLEGFDFVGMEQDAEYCKIAEARINNYQEEPEEPLEFIEENDENKSKYIQTELF